MADPPAAALRSFAVTMADLINVALPGARTLAAEGQLGA
jgi:hypothetical protein